MEAHQMKKIKYLKNMQKATALLTIAMIWTLLLVHFIGLNSPCLVFLSMGFVFFCCAGVLFYIERDDLELARLEGVNHDTENQN
jgi:hypothetical protein